MEYNKILFSYFASATDNIVYNKFSFGYGINYSVNFWREWYRDLGDTVDIPMGDRTTYSNKNLGLTLNSYYKIGKTTYVGIIYRPSLLNIDGGIDPIYEHLISLEIQWKLFLFNLER